MPSWKNLDRQPGRVGRRGRLVHTPVMAERCAQLLGPALGEHGDVLVDATLGLGGHAELFLESFPNLTIVGIDRDRQALALAQQRLARFGSRISFFHSRHVDLAQALEGAGVERVQGFLFDLGVSSLQIDRPDRGFAYSMDVELDMRMDQAAGPTAAEIVNEYPEADLVRILRTYGEERQASRVARRIVQRRAVTPIVTSRQLVEIVRDALPAAVKRTGGNPAKRTFQALRIEVNGELAGLPVALDAALAALGVGGRIAVLSYHSLEDRIVKRRLAAGSSLGVPRRMPVIPDDARPSLRLLTRGGEVPSEKEIADNPRAASARLRAAERIREAA